MPNSPIYNPKNIMLWEEYGKLFKIAKIVPFDKTTLNKEKVNSELISTLNEKYDAYEKYANEYEKLKNNYREECEKNSNNINWLNYEHPTLRSKLLEKQFDWLNKGFKNEIESHIDDLFTANFYSYKEIWDMWDRRFEMSAINSDFKDPYSTFGSFYSNFKSLNKPSNWESRHYTQTELRKAVNLFPIPLEKEYKSEVTSIIKRIYEISFEVQILEIQRTWFTPKLFDSKFWYIPNSGQEIVSDGNLNGVMPSYIDKSIFIKNIRSKIEGSFIGDGLEWLGNKLFGDIKSDDKVFFKEINEGDNENLYLVGFQCKKIPKSPNTEVNLKLN